MSTAETAPAARHRPLEWSWAAGEVVRYAVWIPGSLSLGLLVTVILAGMAPIEFRYSAYALLLLPSAVAAGAAAVAAKKTGKPYWFSLVVVSGWPAYTYRKVVSLVLGRFLNGWLYLVFGIIAVAMLIVAVLTAFGTVTDLDHAARLSAGILSGLSRWALVPLIAVGLVLFAVLFVWWMTFGLISAPLVLSSIPLALMEVQIGPIDFVNPGMADYLLLLIGGAAIFLWLPACVTWTIEQGREAGPGRIALPAAGAGRGRAIYLKIAWEWLLSFPLGPRSQLEHSKRG